MVRSCCVMATSQRKGCKSMIEQKDKQTDISLSNRRHYRSVPHEYTWMEHQETQAERDSLLNEVYSGRIRCATLQAMHNRRGELLIQDIPPGIGKSYATAPLTHNRNIAYFAERHDMKMSVPALQAIPEAQRPNRDNCCNPEEHIAYMEAGYDGSTIHPGEPYHQQWRQEGSMLYMHNHLNTPYPLRHGDAWIIDEFRLDILLPCVRIDVLNALTGVEEGSLSERFLLAVLRTTYQIGRGLREYRQSESWYVKELRGKLVYDMLNEELHGHLASVIEQLMEALENVSERPKVELQNASDIHALPGTGLVIAVRAIAAELPRWQTGTSFNSLVGMDKKGLTVTKRTGLVDAKRTPPVILNDATSNALIASRLLPGLAVKVNHLEVQPPSDMRLIHVNTGKRWNKTSLVDRASSIEQQRYAVRVVQEVLKQEDIVPERLGLITYKRIEDRLGEMLGVATYHDGATGKECPLSLHFGGLRGSNILEECDVLVVIGTPMPALEDIMRYAQAIFYEDTEPILDYQDERFKLVADYLIKSEITQACHRNRPLRYHGRTVIVLSQVIPDNLPVTTEVVDLPRFDANKKDAHERLTEAWEAMEAAGEHIIEKLGLRAHVRRTDASAFYHQKMEKKVEASIS